jgi:hypothetical protein
MRKNEKSLHRMTVPALKKICERRGLETTGFKIEIITRLLEFQRSTVDELGAELAPLKSDLMVF